jgi:hypothetical protein
MLAHPLVEKTRQVLNNAPSKDKEKLYASHELEWLDLRVTKNCVPRALLIMAALIHMLDQEGFKVAVEKKATESTSVVVYGEKIRFGLIERFKQIKPMPKPTGSAYSYNPVRLESTGVCRLKSGTTTQAACRKCGATAKAQNSRNNCLVALPE